LVTVAALVVDSLAVYILPNRETYRRLKFTDVRSPMTHAPDDASAQIVSQTSPLLADYGSMREEIVDKS
jgi:hypothetical protein